MLIGIFISSVGSASSFEGQIQQVVAAESDGFDSFWIAQISGVDTLTLLALAGQRTKRIEMGTAVVPTYSRHPLVLAQQALTTQAATGGRLTLGIGLSHRSSIEDRLGLSYDRPALHMREYLSVLRPLADEGKSSGPHHQDSGEAKIRESTAGVSRKSSSDGKARGCSSKHLCGLTAWNT